MSLAKPGEKLVVRVANDYLWQSGGYVEVHFDLRLQNRGTDFTVYANTGYTDDIRDSSLLVQIMHQLLSPRIPVTSIRVATFDLRLHANTATTADKLLDEIVFAARFIGYEVDYKNEARR